MEKVGLELVLVKGSPRRLVESFPGLKLGTILSRDVGASRIGL